MAKRPDVVVLSRSEKLRDSKRQATSMALPTAVHHRLDMLAEAAKDTEATRAELVAMLIANAPLDSEELELAVMRYRKTTVGDVIPEEQPEVDEREEKDNVISIARRGPGRPSSQRSS